MKEYSLKVQGLSSQIKTSKGSFRPVDDVSFDLRLGETLGLVGESGSGKSFTALSLLRLLPENCEISGVIELEGKNLVNSSEEELRKIRGKDISLIFQEPSRVLNPVFSIGNQISEAVLVHQKMSLRQAQQKATDLLRLVKIPDAKNRFSEYPHQLSGGMKQRVAIAMALACDPKVLIADEVTTALDLTIQSQILFLLKEIQREKNMSLILITHDLGVIANFADKVAIMYAGQLVEFGPMTKILLNSKHPYTKGLMNCVPQLHQKKLNTIPGKVPDFFRLPPGCRFSDRCTYVEEKCRHSTPKMERVNSNWLSRCFLAHSIE